MDESSNRSRNTSKHHQHHTKKHQTLIQKPLNAYRHQQTTSKHHQRNHQTHTNTSPNNHQTHIQNSPTRANIIQESPATSEHHPEIIKYTSKSSKAHQNIIKEIIKHTPTIIKHHQADTRTTNTNTNNYPKPSRTHSKVVKNT